MAPRRESAEDTAARFLALRSESRKRTRMAIRAEANRIRRDIASEKSQRPRPQPGDRIVVDFARATLDEIHARLCVAIVDGLDTQITRIAEHVVRVALGGKP